MANELLNFYNDLFSSTQSCQPDLALETVQCIVIDDMNKDLLAKFTEDEIKKALNQWHHSKHLARMACHLYSINIIGNWWVRISLILFYLS